MKNSSEIDSFIQDILFIDEKKGETVSSIRKLVLDIAPHVKEEIKYGGIVFFIDKTLMSGIFVRKNHISVEFSMGVQMQDPDKILEGTGKYRRHIKIFRPEDIKNKNVKYFFKQSFILWDVTRW